jgi:hypothetical protein
MKTIRKIIIQFSVLILLALTNSSCSDEYLEFDPVAAENSASFYITMSHAEQAVAAAYSTLSTRTAWDRDITMVMGDVPSDDAEAGGDFENEVPDVEFFNRHNQLPTNTHLEDVYGVLFRGIHFSNLGLEKIPNILNTDPNANASIIAIRLAELKFIRALNYLYITNIYGQVPLVDHVLLPSEYFNDKASFRDLYDLIEEDLTDAMSVLPEKSALSSSDVGRATKGAAKALLARLLIFESSYAANYPGDSRFDGLNERWAEVLSICEDLINSGEYGLVGLNGETYSTWHGPETNGYRYLFSVEAENCDESIFEIQYINDGEDYTITRAGSLIQWTSARYAVSPTTGAAISTSYWGLGWPTQSLVDEYEAGDVRFNTNIASPGDTIEMGTFGYQPINFDKSGTGYYMQKYILSNEQFKNAGGHSWQKSPMNIKLLRYADVILMAAESAIMTGDNAKATTYINMVRKRARDCGTSGVPADLSGTISLEQLISERRRELAFEGRRFSDMVRWNIAVERMHNTSTPGGYPIIFESPKNDFLPLPQREIRTSNGNLTQHDGW